MDKVAFVKGLAERHPNPLADEQVFSEHPTGINVLFRWLKNSDQRTFCGQFSIAQKELDSKDEDELAKLYQWRQRQAITDLMDCYHFYRNKACYEGVLCGKCNELMFPSEECQREPAGIADGR